MTRANVVRMTAIMLGVLMVLSVDLSLASRCAVRSWSCSSCHLGTCDPSRISYTMDTPPTNWSCSALYNLCDGPYCDDYNVSLTGKCNGITKTIHFNLCCDTGQQRNP